MIIKFNNIPLAAYPHTFQVTTMDIDDGETSVRTADGTLNRDRIATKKKINMTFGILSWSEISSILQSIKSEFFEVYYPDPELGSYTTKTFYSADRPVPAILSKGGEILWEGLNLSLIER